MPSAADFNNAGTATTLVSNYAILVDENQLDAAHKPTPVGAANSVVCPAANYALHFTVARFPRTQTQALVTISLNAIPGSAPLYYLPWRENCATMMTIPVGTGPSVFMTSTLSGCSVQVHGPQNNPTVTHANAKKAYTDGYSRMSSWLEGTSGMTAEQQHDGAEDRANTIATGKINALLPATGGATSGVVRKADYAAKINGASLRAAQRNFINGLAANQALGSYAIDKSGFKPEAGAFVYGLRDAANNWTFYYQSYVGVKIVVQDKFGGTADQNWPSEAAVLGVPEQFFP